MELIENDLLIYKIFDEAVQVMLPFQLRKFFAWYLISEKIQGTNIWEKYIKFFTEDFLDNKENRALIQINDVLLTEDMSCKSFGLPEPDLNFIQSSSDKDIEKTVVESSIIFKNMYHQLNKEPKCIFKEIINSTHKIFFIDGPGGSGKTFLYKTLIHYYLSKRKNILSMAWTGIASILLPQGMTSHRTFRLPLNLDNIENAFLTSESDKKKIKRGLSYHMG